MRDSELVEPSQDGAQGAAVFQLLVEGDPRGRLHKRSLVLAYVGELAAVELRSFFCILGSHLAEYPPYLVRAGHLRLTAAKTSQLDQVTIVPHAITPRARRQRIVKAGASSTRIALLSQQTDAQFFILAWRGWAPAIAPRCVRRAMQ